ncbi:MAG: CHAT domain-containing protein, partial [Chloroflexales bacterium]|nr:CHAT domain-containing protein [Chloroflexales bacterium]
MADSAADLEIALHRREAEGYTAELRFTGPESDAEVRPGAPGVARFDLAALREAENDPAAYGKLLSDGLYATAEFRQAVAETLASAASQGADLRIRLAVGPSAPELHALRWETLQDPKGSPLVLGQHVRFSRYLASRDWRPVRLRARGDLRALVAVAAPAGLATFNLAPIDAAAELARAQAALGDIPVAALAGGGKATLEAIVAALRDGLDGIEGFDILYLVAHGALVDG